MGDDCNLNGDDVDDTNINNKNKNNHNNNLWSSSRKSNKPQISHKLKLSVNKGKLIGMMNNKECALCIPTIVVPPLTIILIIVTIVVNVLIIFEEWKWF